VTEPGVNVQSASEPIVIFPMRKTMSSSVNGSGPGHVGDDTQT
jgi:hypothetical protein